MAESIDLRIRPHDMIITPNDLAWKDAPPSLPPGSQIAVLEGDPSRPGPFTMRVKLPAGCRIGPHWHPADERVTVISGMLHIGTGDVLDAGHACALPPQSFSIMPAKVHHFAWTTEPTVVQAHGVGPWQIHYLNPADDPRRTSLAT